MDILFKTSLQIGAMFLRECMRIAALCVDSVCMPFFRIVMTIDTHFLGLAVFITTQTWDKYHNTSPVAQQLHEMFWVANPARCMGPKYTQLHMNVMNR